MIDQITIAVIQTNLFWEDIKGNINHFERLLHSMKGEPHIVVLPEMFTTGFSMNAEDLAQSESGLTMQWMIKTSESMGFAICGSFIVGEGDKYYNRFYFVSPSGEISRYDKRHLFTFANENITYTKGNQRVVFDYLGWRILPQICYDVRFPVWSRNRSDYDLIINVANFPGTRRNIWNTLLRARAIENQCYVIGANRVGHDGLDISYTGDSQIVGPNGEPIALAKSSIEEIIFATLDINELNSFRKSFPVLNDADDFIIKIY